METINVTWIETKGGHHYFEVEVSPATGQASGQAEVRIVSNQAIGSTETQIISSAASYETITNAFPKLSQFEHRLIWNRLANMLTAIALVQAS